MNEQQRQAMQSYVDRGYELFVKRCADGRGMTVDQIKEIAEGRVWDGLSALDNGLVDDLGGLRKTIDDMAAELGTDFSHIKIQEYPELTTQWWELLMAMDDSSISAALAANTDLTQAALKRVGPAHQLHVSAAVPDQLHLLQITPGQTPH